MPKYVQLKPASFWKEISPTDKDWQRLGAANLMQMLHHLHLIRAFEETVLELDGQGLVHGPAHSSIGQDGGAVGAMAALRSSDQITGSHRGHHQFLAKALRHVDKAGADALADPLAGDDVFPGKRGFSHLARKRSDCH